MPLPNKKQVPIYIPTYGRLDKQTTLLKLLPLDQKQVILVVRKEEYLKASRLWGAGIDCVIEQTGAGVANARQTALDHCTDSVLIFLDDDLAIDKRVPDWNMADNAKCKVCSPDQIHDALLWLQTNCHETYPAVGLTAKGNNNTIEERWQVENSRIMRSFAVHKPTLIKHNIRFDEFYYWEDFHVALSLLELGYKNLINVAIRTDSLTNASGGVVRHPANMQFVAEAFQKRHPTVSLKKKKMIDPENGGTIEVPDMTVYWKKAFRSKVR